MAKRIDIYVRENRVLPYLMILKQVGKVPPAKIVEYIEHNVKLGAV